MDFIQEALQIYEKMRDIANIVRKMFVKAIVLLILRGIKTLNGYETYSRQRQHEDRLVCG